LNFPTVIEILIAAGFEGYAFDYRRKTAIYLPPKRREHRPSPAAW
jgi:hypothetical protein